jgi:uncharacterized protein with NRDE domain
MCLVVYAHNAVPGYRFVLAANRDEYHRRPTEALHWWLEEPQLLAGRDQQAGGTWLGVADDGRFACVLNGSGAAPSPDAPSRGQLVPRALRAVGSSDACRALARDGARYAGFHLLVGDVSHGDYLTNWGTGPSQVSLAPGCHVLDNTGLNRSVGRSQRAREGFNALCDVSRGALLELLGDTRVPGNHGGDPRPVFVRGSDFGTRCTTLLWAGEDGTITVIERRFDARGDATGETQETWRVHDPASADR